MSHKYFFSVIGAYNEDNTIFDGIKLPDKIVTKGFEDLFQELPVMNKDVFIKNLLIELGELSIKHTNIPFLKYEIDAWSAKNYYNWCQLYETTFYKYNPLWNYIMRRKENTIDDLISSKNASHNTNTNDITTDNLSEVITDNLTEVLTRDGSNNNNDINKVAGFDSNTATLHDSTDSTGSWEDESSKRNTGTKDKHNTGTKTKETIGENSDEENGTENRTIDLTYTASGSLGTSNLASAIAAQRRIIINMYDYIIDAFKQRFCLMIY